MLTTTKRTTTFELPDCFYTSQPTLITPCGSTPKHSLYLSNIDDQKFLRFFIRYLYLYRKSISSDALKLSLSRVLVEYYPLAGRLRTCPDAHDDKLQVDCNGEGALFSEAFMDVTADQFLEASHKPNRSWRKLLCRIDPLSNFLDIPPLLVQITNLRCGGLILCMAINHCLCDGIGTSQFLHAWAHFNTKDSCDLPIKPFHFRHVLKFQNQANNPVSNIGYTRTILDKHHTQIGLNLNKYLQSVPLVPSSLTFTPTHILRLKKQCVPWLKCTTFEVLASHTWRCWVKSLNLSPSSNVKLLFSVNVRKRLKPEIPEGYYGNGFLLGCATANVKELGSSNLHGGVKLVQQAKSALTDDAVKSVIDLLEDKTVGTDVCSSLVISQWSKLGLEDLDFGEGKPLHMGPLSCNIYCLFLPVVGDVDAVRVLVSVPESIVHRFEYYMTTTTTTMATEIILESKEDGRIASRNNAEQIGLIG